jgi:bifunctional UDP-N-acetylglucosamine pyrophosphorylase/glucosamine-1-phosphate N-acetyltransferase
MARGVSVTCPERTWVEVGVELGVDVTLGADVELRGRTRVGDDVRIDAGCVLVDTVVEDGAHVLPYVVATDSVIGAGASVGPFSHLRPGTVLGRKTKIGNFVETKKATFGDGAKASHLAYIGDATVGARCNIGAGTITCNYDGKRKHQTVLGDGVFIGSDSQLVAPVQIGAGAYVGAGSTITGDVPAGALALSRSPQKNIEGWVARKAARDVE